MHPSTNHTVTSLAFSSDPLVVEEDVNARAPIRRRRLVAALAAGMVVATLFWIGLAYRHSDLRRAILLSGFGLC